MKGLTHFISGIAAASFIPEVVHRSMAARGFHEGAESSFLLALAGFYAIMPDTLDFKIGRFFETADVEVFPEVENTDAQGMADVLARTMDKAWTDNRPLRIQFHPIRLANDRWRQYKIIFDTGKQSVRIELGDIVSTSQAPFPGTRPERDYIGETRLEHAYIEPGTARNTTVDILSGPMYEFRREGDRLAVSFLPWHRTWSHSYITGLALALPLWPLAAAFHWHHPWLYPLVAFLGFAVHLTEDLTGYMGGSLLWPFVKKRMLGLKWFHASNPDANFVTDFIAVILLIFNLDRFGGHFIPMSPLMYFLVFLAGPLILYFLPRTFKGKLRRRLGVGERIRQAEAADPKGLNEINDESETLIA